MKVKDVMRRDAKAIWLTESLADAAKEMWENDCGALPIIKDGRKVVGMITDRDICMAAYTQGRRLEEIPVTSAMSTQVFCCGPEDDLSTAAVLMQDKQIRRLPVVDSGGNLIGMLTLNDLVLGAEGQELKRGRKKEIRYADVAHTLAAALGALHAHVGLPRGEQGGGGDVVVVDDRGLGPALEELRLRPDATAHRGRVLRARSRSLTGRGPDAGRAAPAARSVCRTRDR